MRWFLRARWLGANHLQHQPRILHPLQRKARHRREREGRAKPHRQVQAKLHLIREPHPQGKVRIPAVASQLGAHAVIVAEMAEAAAAVAVPKAAAEAEAAVAAVAEAAAAGVVAVAAVVPEAAVAAAEAEAAAAPLSHLSNKHAHWESEGRLVELPFALLKALLPARSWNVMLSCNLVSC